MSKKITTISAMFLFFCTVVVNANAAKKETQTITSEEDTYELLNLFGEVLERAKTSYVDEVSDEQLIQSAINGMLIALDPHSSYMDNKDFKYMNEQTSGKFGGLGIEVTMESGVVKIVSPLDDTPAYKAGLKPGDYIINIDGESVVGMTLNDAVDKMRGKIGSKVKLTIRRLNQKPFEVTIKREEIKIQTVKSSIKGEDVAYIRITSFSEDTDKMVEKAVSDAKKKQKGNLKGIVIDVRNNPGGLLDQAVSVSDLFLNQGEIVSTRSRNEEDTVKYNAKKGDIAEGLPIVVLVVIPLGKHGAMRLTTARYYTPSGRSIQVKGIEPDVEVKPAKIEEIESPFELSEGEYNNALKNENEEKTDAKKQAKAKAEKEELLKDYQLSRAIDLVRAMGIYEQGKSEK